MLFSGLGIAFQKPLMHDFPGIAGDPVMLVLTIISIYSIVGTIFKLLVIKWLGPWLEHRVGLNREVRLRDMFRKGIRSTAILGGTLQAFHGVLFVSLVAYISPAGLAAARACVVVPLAVVELVAGVMTATGKLWYVRLGAALLSTITGAMVVVVAGGTKGLFEESGMVPLILFFLLLTIGNLALAIAENQERLGVHHKVAAAPVYTLARFIAFGLTGVVSAVIWGIVNGRFDIMLAVIYMCWHRWYFIVGIAFFWALTDLSRICVKTIMSATYMFVVMSFAIFVDLMVQIPLHNWWPEIYDNVHTDLYSVLWAVGGFALMVVGRVLYPPQTETRDATLEQDVAPA
ncbi:MAG TPA: hypothetical protein VM581_00155 [Magnetospirillaceae bacterium]|nr:hypothetical protein [Magnetospirillaceae bacterium]